MYVHAWVHIYVHFFEYSLFSPDFQSGPCPKKGEESLASQPWFAFLLLIYTFPFNLAHFISTN